MGLEKIAKDQAVTEAPRNFYQACYEELTRQVTQEEKNRAYKQIILAFFAYMALC